MIIDRIDISKFHGFRNVGFKLGTHITIIAGQNGTQKTTLLGLLGQPFSLLMHPSMNEEKPLCGGSYKSGFKDKFKLSPKFDIPGMHEWTISFLTEDEPLTIASMYRDQKKNNDIRFWKKGSREKGSGYRHYPVIFLSLKRLTPLGEEKTVHPKDDVEFTANEIELFKQLHNRILISLESITDTNIIESPNKTTLGVTTNDYDWMQNSAGQDNVGKIILALLSFKRLKEKYKTEYKGGLLFIDELDATMYPGSQRKLLEVIQEYSTRYKIQVVFTTHSLMLLELGNELMLKAQSRQYTKDDIKLIYLEKRDGNIAIEENMPYNGIVNRLKVALASKSTSKVPVYSEDLEATIVMKTLLSGYTSTLNFSKCKFGCGNLLNIIQIKVPSFCFPECIVLFDGDVREKEDFQNNLKKIKTKKNWLILPTEQSPERFIADFLYSLSDNSPFWPSINPDYTKQHCFGSDSYSIEQIRNDRVVAKRWFQAQMGINKKWCAKALRLWIKSSDNNKMLAEQFVDDFLTVYNNIARELRIPLLTKKKSSK